VHWLDQTGSGLVEAALELLEPGLASGAGVGA